MDQSMRSLKVKGRTFKHGPHTSVTPPALGSPSPVINNVRAVSLFQGIQDDIQKIAAGAGFNATRLEVQFSLKFILHFPGRNKPHCRHSRQHNFLAIFGPLEMTVGIVAQWRLGQPGQQGSFSQVQFQGRLPQKKAGGPFNSMGADPEGI